MKVLYDGVTGSYRSHVVSGTMKGKLDLKGPGGS